MNLYSGAGNTFRIVTDGADRSLPEGLDGLLLLERDSECDFRLNVFNRDGSSAASCGNGLRCIGQYLSDAGFPLRRYRIRTGDKIAEVLFSDGEVGVVLGEPTRWRQEIEPGIDFIDTGVPHLVVWREELEIETAGKMLRETWDANVNFVRIVDGKVHVRTYERGVGETLSCGTGAAAVAAALVFRSLQTFPVTLHFRGGKLRVDQGLTLFGPVEKISLTL